MPYMYRVTLQYTTTKTDDGVQYTASQSQKTALLRSLHA